jgi:lysophospholipase L1-like esterase
MFFKHEETKAMSVEDLLKSARHAIGIDYFDQANGILNILSQRDGVDANIIEELRAEIKDKKAAKKTFHLLINGDSLGLPRCWRNASFHPIIDPNMATRFEQTYAYIIDCWLRDNTDFERISVTNLSAASTTIDLVRMRIVNALHYMNPDLVIQQCGIVDCVYRKDKEGKTYQNNNLQQFTKKYNELLQYKDITAPTKPYIVLSIMPYNSTHKNSESNKIIPAFNEALKKHGKENVTYIDLAEGLQQQEIDKLLHLDGYHLNNNGHINVANKIISYLQEHIKDRIKV